MKCASQSDLGRAGIRARATAATSHVATVQQPRECVPGDQGVCWAQIRAGSSLPYAKF